MSTSATQTSAKTQPVTDKKTTGKFNLIGGKWVEGQGPITRQILNPANTNEVVAAVQEASVAQAEQAVQAAAKAFPAWRVTPAPERAKYFFKFKEILERHFIDLARMLVRENGKLLSEAKGDVRRGIDVVEFACGIPTHLIGKALVDISHNVDSHVVREPLGVVVGITPFNFPAMIPLWMMPVAVACGNTFILKPAEKAPLTSTRIMELFLETGIPEGVVSVVQGGKEVSERLITHDQTQAISFVGSSVVAESVYRAGTHAGKRVQALGGAKNHLLVMPDAELEKSMLALIGSTYGCAGQRCLAGSSVIAIGDKAQQDKVVKAFVEGAKALRLGDGLEESSTLCPVVNRDSQKRVLDWIDRGVKEGAKLLLDGRPAAKEHAEGCYVGPTVFDGVTPDMAIAQQEVFGPVVCMLRANNLDEAIEISNKSQYGNSASLFTQSGAAARTFRERIQCGLLGLNLGVPAPMAFYSFSGHKRSIFGNLGTHGADAVEFYTKKKVVTERWFGAEAPKEGWV